MHVLDKCCCRSTTGKAATNWLRWPLLVRLVRFVCLLAIGAWLGCDRSSEMMHAERDDSPSGSRLVSARVSPRATIDECLATYRRLNSYQDKAQVVLRYRMDGKPQVDRAPLSVAWHRDGRLGLRVYGIQAGPSAGRWRLRLNSNNSSTGAQVLSRAVPESLDFSWLLADPVVAQQLAAGLAGFPPQLDLLISETPFEGLVNDAAQLTFRQPTSIDGRACHVISIHQRGPRELLETRLVIDQATMLLRRITLPLVDLPAQFRSDQSIYDVQLSIELRDVRTNEAVEWGAYEVRPSPDELLVNHFVLPPVPVNTQGVGERVPAFRLTGVDGQEVYNSSSRHASQRCTVLMWLADHPACQVAAEQLTAAAKTIHAAGMDERVEFVCVWAEPQPPANLTFDDLATNWNLPGSLAIDRDALGRDLFGVHEAPTLVVLDSNNRVQLRESRTNPVLSQVLPKLLTRVAQGDDLAAQLIRESDQLQLRYRAEKQLAQAVEARRDSAEKLDLPAYAPLIAEIKELDSFSHAPVAATTQDAEHSLWLLHESGRLSRSRDPARQVGSEPQFEPPWRPDVGSRIVTSPTSDYVVLLQPDRSQIEIFSTSSRQNRIVSLGGELPLDLKWMTLAGAHESRLAVITDRRKTILLDPGNHEQLSGRCPADPVALLASQGDQQTVAGRVVLSDRSVQPIHLSQDSAQRSLPLLGRSASHALPAPAAASEQAAERLTFQPAGAPWHTIQHLDSEWILARGWLARDEPALFMLDKDLAPQWHFRIGLQPDGVPAPRLCAAIDPASGLPVWMMVDADQTIYLMRADGLSDHFRVERPLTGIALTPSGARLLLCLTFRTETSVRELSWR